MFTNDLKKGAMVRLRNGWKAELADNARGTVRLATVYGTFTEIGSIYAHDIVGVFEGDEISKEAIEYTPAQIKCRKINDTLGF